MGMMLVLGACSSSGGKSLAGSSGGGGSSGTTAGSTTGGSSSAAKGKPIVFAVQTNETGPTAAPEVANGAEAAVSAINAAGGVKPKVGGAGRPIKLLTCDSNSYTDPSNAENCARNAVSQGAVLSVADYSLTGDDVKVFSQAHVPMLGAFAFLPADLTTPGVYPFLNGTVLNGGGYLELQHEGAKTIQYIGVQTAAAAQLAAGDAQFLKGTGAKALPPILLPTDPSADLTPYFAKVASENPGGLFIGVGGAQQAQVIKGVRAAGYKGLLADTELNLPTKPWGSYLNGLLVSGNFDASATNSTYAAFRKDMRTYQPSAEADEWALDGWLSVELGAHIATTLTTINGPSFNTAIDGHKVNLGVAPVFGLGVEDKNFPQPQPNLTRATVQYHKIQNGKDIVTGNGDFVDVATHAQAALTPCTGGCPELINS